MSPEDGQVPHLNVPAVRNNEQPPPVQAELQFAVRLERPGPGGHREGHEFVAGPGVPEGDYPASAPPGEDCPVRGERGRPRVGQTSCFAGPAATSP